MGFNFDSWYRRLRIVLEYERILYVISDPIPETTASNDRGSIRDTYQKWLSNRITIRCIMLTMMNDEFSHKFEEAHPEEILQKLKESFGSPNDVERCKVSCAIYNARMLNGASIIDHVLYMIEMIEHLDKLRCPLHEQLGIDAVLNSLHSSYLDFLDHLRMNKPIVNYHGLMALLQTYEKDYNSIKGW